MNSVTISCTFTEILVASLPLVKFVDLNSVFVTVSITVTLFALLDNFSSHLSLQKCFCLIGFMNVDICSQINECFIADQAANFTKRFYSFDGVLDIFLPRA